MSLQAAAHAVPEAREVYGIAAEFETPEAILAAAKAVSKAGYRKFEAYTPFAVEGLDAAVGHKPTRLGFVTLFAGLTGAFVGYFMQWYASAVFYPINVGGRPYNSWPNFIIITFEITVLFAAFSSVLFMIFANGMPRAYHPIFNAKGFENVTRDRFYLCIEAKDAKFNLNETRKLLEKQSPLQVVEVER